MTRTTWGGLLLLSWAVLSVRAGEDTPADVDEVLAVLVEARREPPTTDEGIRRTRAALDRLAKLQPDGAAKTAWVIARDARQSDAVRGSAFYALADLPTASPEQVRAYLLPIVTDKQATRALRMCAAFAFRRERIINEAARAALEAVLLRPGDDHIVQRSCFNTLGAVADLKKIRELVLRPELYRHPYYAVRIDVCTALATLDVRERKTLEILCSLMTDEDPADKRLQVPEEAWLTFWTLTGRAYGVEDKKPFARPPVPASDERKRDYLFRSSFMRPGVTPSEVRELQKLVRADPDELTETRARLRAAADTSRADIDAIVAEWRAAKSK